MEPRTEAVTAVKGRPLGRCTGLLLSVAGALCAVGCASMGASVHHSSKPPTGPVCQVVATWNTQVTFTPDPTHGGTPTPGLAGRLYLFGPNIDFPLAGDGSMVVDLYEDGPTEGKEPRLMEEWRVDPATLARLLRRDAIGWGYTIFLPWGTYRPDVDKVHLKVRYDPHQGSPLYAEGAPLTLNSGTEAGAVMQAAHRPTAR